LSRAEEIRNTTSLNRRFEGKYYPKLQSAIQADIDEVVSIIKESGVMEAMRHLQLHVHSKRIPKIIEALYMEVGLRYARKTWIDLQGQRRGAKSKFLYMETKGFGFNAQWVEWLKDRLFNFLLEKITFAVAKTTREAMLRVLNEAITEGWGLDKILNKLEDQDDFDLSRTQAARITRTEITRAANAGVMAGGETFPFLQTKEWIAAKDNRTRGQEEEPHASHVLLNGQVIDFEAMFIDPVNGDELYYPGDPDASAASTINCRCNVALKAKRDANGLLIPKEKFQTV
jgi:hypothetical protein